MCQGQRKLVQVKSRVVLSITLKGAQISVTKTHNIKGEHRLKQHVPSPLLKLYKKGQRFLKTCTNHRLFKEKPDQELRIPQFQKKKGETVVHLNPKYWDHDTQKRYPTILVGKQPPAGEPVRF
jgi:hypothetical protein